MESRKIRRLLTAVLFAVLSAGALTAQTNSGSWFGVVRGPAGGVLTGARVELRGPDRGAAAVASADGAFEFRELAPGRYSVAVVWSGGTAAVAGGIEIASGTRRGDALRVTASGEAVLESATEGTGGEQLSERQVSALPLNKRDFSQLLLLAAGTQTDTNGAANFTQQMTVNGQRGTATVFAMDGIDTTDPEMGGATFSNFNVDAID